MTYTEDSRRTATAMLLKKLMTLQRRFRDWLLLYDHGLSGSPFQAVSVWSFVEFIAQHGPLADSVPVALAFPFLKDALVHNIYYAMLLPLRESIYDLAMQPQSLYLTTKQQRDTLLGAVNECAELICQAVPYMTTTPGGERAIYSTLLWTAARYEKQGNVAKTSFFLTLLRKWSRASAESTDWVSLRDGASVGSNDFIDSDGILVRRILWQDVIGPERCILARRCNTAHGDSTVGPGLTLKPTYLHLPVYLNPKHVESVWLQSRTTSDAQDTR